MFYLLSFLGFFWPLQRDSSVFCHLGVLPLKFLWNSQNYQECAKKYNILREGMPMCFYHNFRIKICRAVFVIITDVMHQ